MAFSANSQKFIYVPYLPHETEPPKTISEEEIAYRFFHYTPSRVNPSKKEEDKKAINIPEHFFNIENLKGVNHFLKKEYQEAIECFQKLLRYTRENKDTPRKHIASEQIARIFYHQGVNYSLKEEYEVAVECFEKALRYVQQEETKQGISAHRSDTQKILFKNLFNKKKTALIDAVKANCTERIVDLLKDDCPISIVKALFSHPDILAINDKWKEKLLIYAAQRGFTEIVNVLILNGCDVNTVDEKGMTPFIHVIRDSKGSVASALMDVHQCDINAADIFGKTAFVYAAEESFIPQNMLNLFEHPRYDRTHSAISSKEGITTLLTYALKIGYPSIVISLLAHPLCDIKTAFMHALLKPHLRVRVIIALLKYSLLDRKKALRWAGKKGFLDRVTNLSSLYVQRLLEKGILTHDVAWTLSPEQRDRLENPLIYSFVFFRIIPIERVLAAETLEEIIKSIGDAKKILDEVFVSLKSILKCYINDGLFLSSNSTLELTLFSPDSSPRPFINMQKILENRKMLPSIKLEKIREELKKYKNAFTTSGAIQQVCADLHDALNMPLNRVVGQLKKLQKNYLLAHSSISAQHLVTATVFSKFC